MSLWQRAGFYRENLYRIRMGFANDISLRVFMFFDKSQVSL